MSEFNVNALTLIKRLFEGRAAESDALKAQAGFAQNYLRKTDEYASVHVVMEDNPGKDDRVYVTCDRAPASLQKFITVYEPEGETKRPAKTENFGGQDDAIIIEFECTIDDVEEKTLKFLGSKVIDSAAVA